MKKVSLIILTVVSTSINVTAAPLGINGLSAGIGGGGLTSGFLTAEYDFEISKYVCVGPELGLGFGGNMAIYLGGAGRLYVVPDQYDVFEPHIAFGLGFAHRFEGDEGEHEPGHVPSLSGMYVTAGPGCDFEIPNSPIAPYIDIGGFFFFGDNSDADFKAEIGVRVDL